MIDGFGIVWAEGRDPREDGVYLVTINRPCKNGIYAKEFIIDIVHFTKGKGWHLPSTSKVVRWAKFSQDMSVAGGMLSKNENKVYLS